MSPRSIALLLLALAALRAEPVATARKPGEAVADVPLPTEAGDIVKLRELVAAKPPGLIFYRGWCPYCQKHLPGLAGLEADHQAAGTVNAFGIAYSVDDKTLAMPERKTM